MWFKCTDDNISPKLQRNKSRYNDVSLYNKDLCALGFYIVLEL